MTIATGCKTDDPWIDSGFEEAMHSNTQDQSLVKTQPPSYTPEIMSSVRKPFIFQGKVFAEHVSPSQNGQVEILANKLKSRKNKNKLSERLALKQKNTLNYAQQRIAKKNHNKPTPFATQYNKQQKTTEERNSSKPTKTIRSYTFKPTKTVRSYTFKPQQQYVVKQGDTLKSISLKVYGTELLWETIYHINKNIIGNNSRQLDTGITISTGKDLSDKNLKLAH